ncbi:hypothetical protein GCM10027612_17400 [Microbispora bryophytorum subsp. camponoti]
MRSAAAVRRRRASRSRPVRRGGGAAAGLGGAALGAVAHREVAAYGQAAGGSPRQALGHLLFGEFTLSVTVALLVGSIPGVYLGSRISSRAPGGLIRRVLAFVLLASALKMFGVGNTQTVWGLVAVLLLAPAFWMVLRVRCGLPALPWRRETQTAGR